MSASSQSVPAPAPPIALSSAPDSAANATSTRPVTNAPARPAARPRSAPAPAPAKRPPGPVTREPVVLATGTTSRPECHPPYVIDSNGKTVWKKDCL
jgi:hypothetical protein